MLPLIKELHFFKGIEESKLEQMLPATRLHTYNASEIMSYEEDAIERVFFLLKGEVKFYKVDRYDNEVFLYTLSSDSLLTNIGSLEDNHISCFSTIEFLCQSSVLSFDIEVFKRVVKSENLLLQNLVNALAEQKQLMDCTINMGMVYDGTAKVAKMIYHECDLFNRLKKQEIAYRLNIQPSTLSRILAKLIRLGMIEEINHQVRIIQKKALHDQFYT